MYLYGYLGVICMGLGFFFYLNMDVLSSQDMTFGYLF